MPTRAKASILLLVSVVALSGMTLLAYSWYRWDRAKHLVILYAASEKGRKRRVRASEVNVGV